nr:histone-lysine N-methyltransferase, H3 lysine-79 specific-like [Procambarus clarkii]
MRKAKWNVFPTAWWLWDTKPGKLRIVTRLLAERRRESREEGVKELRRRESREEGVKELRRRESREEGVKELRRRESREEGVKELRRRESREEGVKELHQRCLEDTREGDMITHKTLRKVDKVEKTRLQVENKQDPMTSLAAAHVKE